LRRQAEQIPHESPVVNIPAAATAPQQKAALSENIHDVDYLDIPAFLRRREEA
jgi:hypothetical protein